MATGSNIEDMVKAIEKDEGYKVLLKHEYEALLALASKREVAKSDPTKLNAKHNGNTQSQSHQTQIYLFYPRYVSHS